MQQQQQQQQQHYGTSQGSVTSFSDKPTFSISNKVSSEPVTKPVLADKFNILLTAKAEYQLANSESNDIDIIPLIPPYKASLSWISTIETVYSSLYERMNKPPPAKKHTQPNYYPSYIPPQYPPMQQFPMGQPPMQGMQGMPQMGYYGQPVVYYVAPPFYQG
jgi:hypothetical protein